MSKAFFNKLLLKQIVRKIEIFDNYKTSFILIKNPDSQNHTKYIDMTNVLSYTSSNKRKKTRN